MYAVFELKMTITPHKSIPKILAFQPKDSVPSNKRNTILTSSICETFDTKTIYLLVALAALKRKKRYEKQLQNIDGTLSTVEFQLEALQNAQSNKQVLDTMKVGAQALKQAHGNM